MDGSFIAHSFSMRLSGFYWLIKCGRDKCHLNMRLTIYGLVILTSLLLPNRSVGAQGHLCKDVFSESEARKHKTEITDEDLWEMITYFANLNRYSRNENAIEEHFIKTSKSYANYKNQASPHSQPLERVFSFLKKYFNWFFQPQVLTRLRSESLSLQLKAWGERTSSENGYVKLKNLSALNVDRIQKHHKLKKLEELPSEIQTLVKKIDFEYRHNTSRSNISGPIMLSSARLREAGLPNTMQSRFEFNRNVVRSDDQLYFYVQPTTRAVKGNDGKNIPSRYGGNSLYLDKSFAETTGWISPYIMDVADLSLYREALIKTGHNVKDKTDVEMIEWLHLNAFTISDIKELYQTILGNYLINNVHNLAQDNFLPSVETLRKRLEAEFYTDAPGDFRKFMNAFGISGGLMELKVPVAIEREYLSVAKPNDF